MLFTFERHVTLKKSAYFCKTGLLSYIISGCKGNKSMSFPPVRQIMTAWRKLISMSLAKHPVSALLSNKNLSPQKLNTVYICHIPQYCRTPNQMVLSTTIILMLLIYGITNMKEAQLMCNIFTSSVYDNLLWVTEVFTVTAEWVQHGHHLPLPCVKVKKTLPFQCTWTDLNSELFYPDDGHS